MHDAFPSYFAKLRELYAKEEALHKNDYEKDSFRWIDADNLDQNLCSYVSVGEHKDVVVILNFSANAYIQHRFGIPHAGKYKEILNSELDTCGL